MKRKSFLLLFCVIVVATMFVLAAGLREVQFQPGRTLSAKSTSSTPLLLPVLQFVSETPLWRLLLFWLASVIIIVLCFYLLPPELRKRIVRQMLSFATGILLLLLALRYRILDLPELSTEPANPAGQAGSGVAASSGFPVFQPPQLSVWVTYLLSLAALLGIFILIDFLYRSRKRSRSYRFSSLNAIANIAHASLQDLKSGRDWGDVVIESYARMSDVVGARRGLQRGASATAREFADRLARAGLPAESVSHLTRLFEAARYSGRRSSQIDTKEAVNCLHEIMKSCEASP